MIPWQSFPQMVKIKGKKLFYMTSKTTTINVHMCLRATGVWFAFQSRANRSHTDLVAGARSGKMWVKIPLRTRKAVYFPTAWSTGQKKRPMLTEVVIGENPNGGFVAVASSEVFSNGGFGRWCHLWNLSMTPTDFKDDAIFSEMEIEAMRRCSFHDGGDTFKHHGRLPNMVS